MTVSDIEGRLRVRCGQLKNPSVAETIREALAASREVYEIRANMRAGSLLVLYRYSTGTRDEIMSVIDRHLPANKRDAVSAGAAIRPVRFTPPVQALSARRLTNSGMMISLALSLLGAAFDLKRLHVISGILFIGVLGFHLSSKRRRLFA